MSIPDASVNYSASGGFGNRFWQRVFYALLLLECAPIWVFRYLPSTDGPSHIYNASVLANYGIEIYRRYYEIVLFQPAGNVFTQFVLAALLRLTGPVIARQLFLSGYVILFFMSLRYFLRALTPYADYFSCFAGVLASNYFFYMGAWNFLYGVCFVLLTLGYYVRQQQGRARRSLPLLMFAGLVIYMTHAVSWLVCVAAIATLDMQSAILAMPWGQGRPLLSSVKIIRDTLMEHVKGVCSLLPPGVFILVYYFQRSQEDVRRFAQHLPAGQPPQTQGSGSLLHSLVHHLLGFWFNHHAQPYRFLQRVTVLSSMLHSFTGSERTLSECVAGALFIALLFVTGVECRRRRSNVQSTWVLVVTLMCLVGGIAAPTALGTGDFRLRLSLYAWLFVVASLAAGARLWRRTPLNAIAALSCCIALMGGAMRLPVLSKWNERLSALAAMGQRIRPGSTVLQLNLDYPEPLDPENPHGVIPYLHAVDLLSTRGFIDLRNYEASMSYFTVKFRPDVSPFPGLGALYDMEATPPIFDIIRYEKETRGRVDYLLFQGGAVFDKHTGRGLEDKLYRDRIAAFTLVASGEGGNLRLYERAPSGLSR